ncbi:L-threonate dehydrogenase [Brucella gallinifaecis]|uniref:L-threonate dehydrogenase n=1 Tax=Brucella gallinifaecis TaxID=215590 RepID=A0A502BMD9_9HYPH|nr:L-threonate dehydrogenase [Brucella gallinifaecis]TPF74476.1 NAD(P)-dependent oxidoreductase [Brucella gallinifaecis]
MSDYKVAVIGLGSMGMGAAKSLLRNGVDVTGYDLNTACLDEFSKAGGKIASSAAEAAQGANALILMVVNAAQTDAALFQPAHGCAFAMQKGGVVISCATMSPEDAGNLSAKAENAGLHYLDAPVSGGAIKAEAGEITVMASGTQAAFDAADAALSAIAGKVYNLGDRAGLGAAYKIVNQLLAGVHIAAACEAMTFAGKLGLDLDKVYEVITASAGNSWMFENRVPHILEGDYSPRSAVDIFTKDLGIVANIGHKEKFPLPVAGTALQMFLATAAAGMGKDDDASVARMIAQITGINLPQKAV